MNSEDRLAPPDGLARHHRSDLSEPLALDGCRPTPLASYLKGLGVFRLLSEQRDPTARAAWHGEQLVLYTRLDRSELLEFLLQEYRPSPIMAPWNGGSGFYFREQKLKAIDPETGKRKKTGKRTEPTEATRTLELVAGSSADRLEQYRLGLAAATAVLQALGHNEAPKELAKDQLLRTMRSELPEPAVACFDAALALGAEKTMYPPLLGTGGTDGNLDFTNNFMQRLVEVINLRNGQPTHDSKRLLESTLFDQATPGLSDKAIGQFDPGSAGGPNASTGFEGNSRVNPWEFILMIEGALLFAAAITRRLESNAPGMLSYPFTVRPLGAGSGVAAFGDESSARAEIWMPLWSAPASLLELRALLSDGKATLGRRPAGNGLDFVRAVSQLGVDRGIGSFQRYAFMRRSGKAYLATPLNRVEVQRNPAADLIFDLDSGGWLDRFRRFARGKLAAARARSLSRRLENAIFETCLNRQDPGPSVQSLLEVLGQIERYFAVSPAARKECPPIPWLGPHWFIQADDGSHEVNIAAALASLHARRENPDGGQWTGLRIRTHLGPIKSEGRLAWTEDAHKQVTWNNAPFETNLLSALQRRLLIAKQMALPDRPLAAKRYVDSESVQLLLSGTLDMHRIERLLLGLALVNLPAGGPQLTGAPIALPAAWHLLKPFFCTNQDLIQAKILAENEKLTLPPELIRRLAGRDLDQAVRLAVHRLRASGLPLKFGSFTAPKIDSELLAASLLVPIAKHSLADVLPLKQKSE